MEEQMRFGVVLAAVSLALLAGFQPVRAADPAPAKTMITAFVDKGSSSAVTKAINKMHAKMEAEGWTCQYMGVYTEDDDLQGVFVTYVRQSAP
jgi:hypothetical protein